MRMIRAVDLAWTPGRRSSGGWMWGLLLLLTLGLAALLYAKSAIDARLHSRQGEMERLVLRSLADGRRVSPERARSAGELRLLHDQVLLLNRDWAGLLHELVPGDHGSRLLVLDIDAVTGVLRVSGRARDAKAANLYAETIHLESGAVRDVRLLLLERKPDGIDFEVSARWAE
ncbi:hypothetical protein H0E84_02080 [Luteimonas sp. SJ-92]|uniref:PilN domain-containing protein n=1 Tax=Luteimonas salinisoli TaxID=2752307 RepID=A0A853J8Y9_9GAMM|nr:hypothetical protein [Luteimonas salinisoli]NZA25159.1 hypothetical protein [Luteimonas salinisoli]